MERTAKELMGDNLFTDKDDKQMFRKVKSCMADLNRGGYYTLEKLITFDQHGLWSFHDVRFSAAGTLVATTAARVSDAPAGHLSEELDNLLHVGTQDVLRKLVD